MGVLCVVHLCGKLTSPHSHMVPLPLCKEACPRAGMYKVHHGVKKKTQKSEPSAV